MIPLGCRHEKAKHVRRSFRLNYFLCSPFQVQRGIRQGCPLSGLLFCLLLELLLINLRLSLSGFVPSPEEHHIIVSPYTDDICVIIRNDQDRTTLLDSLHMFHRASSLKVNWQKSNALWVFSVTRTSGWPPLAPPHSLPKGLSWEREGVKYLGVYLGPYQCSLMNWEGMVDDVTKRLQKWKHFLPQMSFRGRTLIVNTSVASVLWHRFICLQPPDTLLKDIQRILVSITDTRKKAKNGQTMMPLMLRSTIRSRSCQDRGTSKVRPTWEIPWWYRSYVLVWKISSSLWRQLVR
uniref:Reverse transcriptase domain-containing protein n=1 Tax=Eptatretus burgeri TaxID=7764 RepID=A0A8C4QFJ7_EPTBU